MSIDFNAVVDFNSAFYTFNGFSSGSVISNVQYQIKPNSLSVENTIEERSTADFAAYISSDTVRIQKGEPVEVYRMEDGGTLQTVFKGVVEDATRKKVAPGQADSWWEIKAIDYHYFADKRRVAKSYVSQTCAAIITDLIATYLAAEGITAGTIETGPTITGVVFNYITVAEAIQQLAEAANFWWIIDFNKQLHFRARSALAAPWTADADDMYKTPEIEEGNPKYRNRQYIRGGKDITDAQTETKKGDSNQRDFAVGYPIAKVPTITKNGGAQTVGIKGLDTGKNWYWSKGDATITQERTDAVLTASDTLVITYQGEFDVVTLSDDVGEIVRVQSLEGGTGYVDDVFDDPDVNSRQEGFDVGAALLEKYASVGRKITFTTKRSGLSPGQLLIVDLPAYNIENAEFLITQVTIEGDKWAEWTVLAVEGPWQGSWQRLFSSMAKTGERIDFVSTASQATVTILVTVAEEIWTWGETSAVTVFACPIPSTSLNPSASLFPC